MSKPVPLLLYADDLAILSTRAEGLQNMLDALQDFSQKRRLTVNLKKTEVLVFEPRRTLCQDFTYGERVLARKDSFKYLGLWFHATQQNFGLALGSLADSARKAMHAMRRRCFQLGYVNPRRMCNLFNALVLPSAMAVRCGSGTMMPAAWSPQCWKAFTSSSYVACWE